MSKPRISKSSDSSIIKIKDSTNESDANSKFLGICFKILLNYMQMIGIIASFDMKWPFYTRGFFSIQSGIGSLSTQFFSLDCLAKGKLFFLIYFDQMWILENSLNIDIVYVKVLFASLLPFAILILNMIYWGTKKCFFHTKNTFNLFFFTSIIIQFFLQPTVIKEITNPLLCSSIDGKLFMRKALDFSCEDSTYNTWVIYKFINKF